MLERFRRRKQARAAFRADRARRRNQRAICLGWRATFEYTKSGVSVNIRQIARRALDTIHNVSLPDFLNEAHEPQIAEGA